MGWFENQIEERGREDERRLAESLRGLSDAITGRSTREGTDAAVQARSALSAVLAYYGERLPEGLDSVKRGDIADFIDNDLRTTGIMARPVRLTRGWQGEAVGAMLGFLKDGSPVALLPRTRGGYRTAGTAAGEEAGARGISGLQEEAYCFYRPLPLRKLAVPDLVVFMLKSLDRSDYAAVIAATAAATLIGMLVPSLNRIIFGPVIASGKGSIIIPVFSLLVGIGISQVLLNCARSLCMARLNTKIDVPLEAAIMMRVLSLPASFFAAYQTGELSSRITSVSIVAKTLQSVLLAGTLTSVFSLVYVLQIANIAPALVVPALAVIVASTVLSLLVVVVQQRVSKRTLELSAQMEARQYSLISGIQKIKLAGAEKRAFATWADEYASIARLNYNGPAILRLSTVIQSAISLAGTLAIYVCAIAGGVGVAGYMAFTSAFGMVSGAFSGITASAAQLAEIKPVLEMASPILEAVPEAAGDRRRVSRISGGFELDHVTFAYPGCERPVLHDLSLKVRPGDYVAVVGKTGCGKSTLMRLLLGFEKPQRGAVCYDGCDLARLDVQGVRRNIGVVLQNGKLMSGSIFDNIAISTPGLTLDEAWEAAELAGVADDIRAMPMGIQTVVSEGAGGISGGQRQRLMIARAIAAKPKILMFDEATSALDNVTQRKVSESLDGLKCTRLVIAHRLSTIKNCDRIVLLDEGRIAQDGTYDELMACDGLFAQLVARQRV